MKRFCTTYELDGVKKGACVDAIDWEHAQAICDDAGFGEIVTGVLWQVQFVDEKAVTPELITRLKERLKSFASDIYLGDPPTPDDFGYPAQRPN